MSLRNTILKDPVTLVGNGDTAALLSRALIRAGYPLYHITRIMDFKFEMGAMPEPRMVIIASPKSELNHILKQFPQNWYGKIGLIQDGLLPSDWEEFGITNPTVASLWVAKKHGMDYKAITNTPIFGPNADILKDAIDKTGLPCHIVEEEGALIAELIRKRIYMLLTHCAFLCCNLTVGELWTQHNQLSLKLAREGLKIEEWRNKAKLQDDKFLSALKNTIKGDLEHKCKEHISPHLLDNQLRAAERAGIDTPELRKIHDDSLKNGRGKPFK